MSALLADHVDLVGDDDGRHMLPFGYDQVAIQHAQVGGRFGTGEYEQRLIGVCEQDLLIDTLRPWVEPDDGALAFFDLLDDAGPVGEQRDTDAVAQGGDIAGGAAPLELAAQLANDKALSGLHCKETGLGLDDQYLVQGQRHAGPPSRFQCLSRQHPVCDHGVGVGWRPLGRGVLVGAPPTGVAV